jgi:hypothetical protein
MAAFKRGIEAFKLRIKAALRREIRPKRLKEAEAEKK